MPIGSFAPELRYWRQVPVRMCEKKNPHHCVHEATIIDAERVFIYDQLADIYIVNESFLARTLIIIVIVVGALFLDENNKKKWNFWFSFLSTAMEKKKCATKRNHLHPAVELKEGGLNGQKFHFWLFTWRRWFGFGHNRLSSHYIKCLTCLGLVEHLKSKTLFHMILKLIECAFVLRCCLLAHQFPIGF